MPRPIEDLFSAERQTLVCAGSPVVLHIYDVQRSAHMQLLNRLLSVWGTGAFHAGVEVYEREFSFFCDAGIAGCPPKCCEGHAYVESVEMGVTTLTKEEVTTILQTLKREWPASGYHIMRRNCCHFSDELCQVLVGSPVPSRLKNLAQLGEALTDGAQEAVQQALGASQRVASRSWAAAWLGAALCGGSRGGPGGRFGADDLRATPRSPACSSCGSGLAEAVRRHRSNVVAVGKAARGASECDAEELGDFSRGALRRLARGRLGSRAMTLTMTATESATSGLSAVDWSSASSRRGGSCDMGSTKMAL